MSQRDRVVALLIAAHLVDVLFDLMPPGGEQRDFFPFFDGYGGWDGKMTAHNYVYAYCGHLYRVLMLRAVYEHTGREFWKSLVWLEVLDAVDYALHYNHTYFDLFGHGIDFNYFKFMAVLYLTNREYAASS